MGLLGEMIAEFGALALGLSQQGWQDEQAFSTGVRMGYEMSRENAMAAQRDADTVNGSVNAGSFACSDAEFSLPVSEVNRRRQRLSIGDIPNATLVIYSATTFRGWTADLSIEGEVVARGNLPFNYNEAVFRYGDCQLVLEQTGGIFRPHKLRILTQDW